jgi:hypothetical protein
MDKCSFCRKTKADKGVSFMVKGEEINGISSCICNRCIVKCKQEIDKEETDGQLA